MHSNNEEKKRNATEIERVKHTNSDKRERQKACIEKNKIK